MGMMETEESRPAIERKSEREAENYLRKIGQFETVERFIRKYGNVRTRRVYLHSLLKHLNGRKHEGGVLMTPDELISDNLKCVFGSSPQDVRTKRKHTEWLDQFTNEYLVSEGLTDLYRTTLASAVQQFYMRNDSPLFGDFQISNGSLKAPPKPLPAEDIRRVLKACTLSVRTPLLLIWQSGCEVNRILSLRWGQVRSDEVPPRLDFTGRKKHKPYSTFLGRDSVEHLKLWQARWVETFGREPSDADFIFITKGGRARDHIAIAFSPGKIVARRPE